MVAPYRIMTVCTGNICRSPMAEVVLQQRFVAANLEGVVLDSTGVSAEESGHPMDRRARTVLQAHGYDASGRHRARQITPAQVQQRDLILAMTVRHAAIVGRLVPDASERIRLYRSFDPDASAVRAEGHLNADSSERALDMPDPWYGGPADFEKCLESIEAAADHILDFVRAEWHRRTA